MDERLKALIGKLEAATAPDRQLDYAIERELPFKSTATPHYTSSIDAALTVIPPEYGWNVNWWGFVQLFRKEDEAAGGAMRGLIVGDQRPPAIALCVAGLRARMAKQALKSHE